MRVALLHPTYWPEVMRGSERVVHGLGSSLARRGHEVTLLTSHPAATRVSHEDGMRIVRSRRPPRPPLMGGLEYHLEGVPALVWRLARGEFDLAHAHFPADAWAATLARRLGGPPVVMTMHGIPLRQYLVARRYRLEMLRFTAERAGACTVVSEPAADAFRRYLPAEPEVIGNGLFVEDFAVDAARAEVPTVLCTASLGDPRKRGGLLLEAFTLLRERIGDVRLVAARGRDPVMSGAEPELPAGAEWFEPDHRPDVLARRYAEAWVTVLPAVYEAFGLVLVESLAAGTPVVADTSGAAPQIVGDDAVGRLYRPDDAEDLARAMAQALELARDPATAQACRARAERFDWAAVVERYERLYERVVRAGPGARASQKS